MTSAVPKPTNPLPVPASGGHCGRQRHAAHQRMQAPCPPWSPPTKVGWRIVRPECGGGSHARARSVAWEAHLQAVMVLLGRAFRYVMVVVREKPLEEEHHQEAAQGPMHGLVQGMGLMRRMGNEMEQRHAEHQPGNKAHCRLQPRMSEPHGQQQPAARQRGQQHESAIDSQARPCRDKENAFMSAEGVSVQGSDRCCIASERSSAVLGTLRPLPFRAAPVPRPAAPGGSC